MAARWRSLSPVWNQLQELQSAPMWGQLQSLQNEMNRLFDRWGDGGRAVFGGGYPALNLWEDSDALYLEAELPGVCDADLEITVTAGNQLTLKGQRQTEKPEKGVWHRQERATGQFVRTLSLPFDVDGDKVDARLEHGVLRLKLAKHEAAKPRKIKVKGE